jgi:DNA processing protein
LIRQGAKLVESAQDILEELRWGGAASVAAITTLAQAKPDGAEEQVLAFLGDAPCALDTLSARSGLTPADLLAMLLPMELAGRVAQLPGGLYQRLH